jgi:hypothetical protein
MVLALILLSGCASDQLAPLPPQGVDLSGHWKLDVADSDDPLRLMQSQISSATAGAGAGGQTGQTGGQGGRGRGGGGARGGGGGGFGGGPAGPAMPSVSALEEGLRWPGQDLTLSQKAGIVTFTDGGRSRMCRAMGHQKPHHRPPPPDGNGDPGGGDARGRDAPARGRGDAPPPLCGWDDKTLVVKSGDPDDDHPPFELRFSVSDDSQRLIEVVAFTGGRSSGFVASRVWDRTQP